jgi:serine protease Do
LSARRLVLLATVAGLGATALIVGTDARGVLPTIGAAIAETAQRPVGFGDLVEKVKPAVISVRVKMHESSETTGFDADRGAGAEPGFPEDRFFRQFGLPRGDKPSQPKRNFTMGQGSGFFITADGYAITNNHVVEKAEEVEVKTDNGKTYTAKVIGTDPKTDLALIKVEGRKRRESATGLLPWGIPLVLTARSPRESSRRAAVISGQAPTTISFRSMRRLIAAIRVVRVSM